mmetsp:Transcript_15742/g.36660  ORF Transcript_15742/g.36660 Transcript_15742/m.36660 type:complete len:211 (+) Transcript_15742:886-1518(+)
MFRPVLVQRSRLDAVERSLVRASLRAALVALSSCETAVTFAAAFASIASASSCKVAHWQMTLFSSATLVMMGGDHKRVVEADVFSVIRKKLTCHETRHPSPSPHPKPIVRTTVSAVRRRTLPRSREREQRTSARARTGMWKPVAQVSKKYASLRLNGSAKSPRRQLKIHRRRSSLLETTRTSGSWCYRRSEGGEAGGRHEAAADMRVVRT